MFLNDPIRNSWFHFHGEIGISVNIPIRTASKGIARRFGESVRVSVENRNAMESQFPEVRWESETHC